MCRVYVSYFKPGEFYILALTQGISTIGVPGETENDYCISICGEHVLRFDNEKKLAFSNLNKGKKFTLSFLKEQLKKQHDAAEKELQRILQRLEKTTG